MKGEEGIFPRDRCQPGPFTFILVRGDCNLPPFRAPNPDGFYDARYDRFYDSASDDEQARAPVEGWAWVWYRYREPLNCERAERRCLKGKSDN